MMLHSNIALPRVRGNGTYLGNEVADELVRKCANLSAEHTDHFCGIPLSAYNRRVEELL